MRIRKLLLSSTVLAFSGCIAGAADQPVVFKPGTGGSLPAVSGINFKIDGFAGSIDSDDGLFAGTNHGDSIKGGRASFTMPLGHAFGLQVDAAAGEWGGDSFGGGAAHLFWRDPAKGLLGIFGSYSQINAVQKLRSNKLGLEGEIYSGRYTFSGIAGWEDSSLRSSRPFAYADFAYYPVDNLKLSIGYRHTSGLNLLALGAEAMAPLGKGAAISTFAEGRYGENHRGVIAGLRLYWGPADKSLIRRHREDDPVVTNMPDDMFTQACPSNTFWDGVMCEQVF